MLSASLSNTCSEATEQRAGGEAAAAGSQRRPAALAAAAAAASPAHVEIARDRLEVRADEFEGGVRFGDNANIPAHGGAARRHFLAERWPRGVVRPARP